MKKIVIIMAVLGAIALGGCKEEPLQPYTAGEAICFYTHSFNLSFYGLTVEEQSSEIVKMGIHIMGFTKPYDRAVTGAVIEKGTTATPDEYRILGGMIPANTATGIFEVELMNRDKLATDELILNVALTENEHFVPGLKENYTFRLLWSQKLVEPDSWDRMRSYFCAVYSSQCYKAIILATGRKQFYNNRNGPDPDDPEHRQLTSEAMYTYAVMFGNYIRQYNAEHPDAPMLHDDGPGMGSPIVPIY